MTAPDQPSFATRGSSPTSGNTVDGVAGDPIKLRQQLAEALMRWHGKQLLCMEHTQIISYGEAADAVLAVVQERIDAKDAEIARLADTVRRTADAANHAENYFQRETKRLNTALDQAKTWISEWSQRAEAAERELADLRDKAARLDELERSIGA